VWLFIHPSEPLGLSLALTSTPTPTLTQVYRHPGVSHAADQVVATLTLWAPRRDSLIVAAQTRAHIHVESGCSPAAATVDGDGLTTGRPLTVTEVRPTLTLG